MASLLIFIILMIILVICVVFFYMFKFSFQVFFGKRDCSVCSPDGDCPLDRCDLEDPCDESCEGCKNYNPEKNCNK